MSLIMQSQCVLAWHQITLCLVFLAFLKPIINGIGYDFKEVQVSEEKRLDVVITYERKKYLIELKMWRGKEAHRRKNVSAVQKNFCAIRKNVCAVQKNFSVVRKNVCAAHKNRSVVPKNLCAASKNLSAASTNFCAAVQKHSAVTGKRFSPS